MSLPVAAILGTIGLLQNRWQNKQQQWQYGLPSAGDDMYQRFTYGKQMMQQGGSPQDINTYMQGGAPGGRPPLGMEGQQAATEQARAVQSVMNQQLTSSIIPNINRQWGAAGRFSSGGRLGAIQNAMSGAQQQVGSVIGQNALQVYLAQLQSQDTRDWNQAQLDLAGAQQPGLWSAAGNMAPLLLEYYLGNKNRKNAQYDQIDLMSRMGMMQPGATAPIYGPAY